MKKSFQAIGTVNAEIRFIEAVQKQFGKSEEEARIILEVFKQEEVVKIDPIRGRFDLISGVFWDAQVMNNTLKIKDFSKIIKKGTQIIEQKKDWTYHNHPITIDISRT